MLFRLLIGSLIGVSALLGCSASGVGGFAGAGGSGSGASANSAAGTTGTPLPTAAGSGGRPNLDVDVGVGDGDSSTACSHLNIGILGIPGSNASSNFEQWLVTSGTSVQRIQTAADVPLTTATLQPFDVVILDLLSRDYTEAEASIFAAWVAAGGGVAVMSGYHDDKTQDWHANSLLAPLGLAYSGQLLYGPVSQFASQPITVGLTSVTFAGGYGISALGGSTSTLVPIAFLPMNSDKAVVGYAVQMGAGRAFVWGDEWIEFDSEWSSQPQIPQLWVQVFGWISPTTRCALQVSDEPRGGRACLAHFCCRCDFAAGVEAE